MIPQRTVEANEFVLRDLEGKKRAVLGLEDGQPNLVLFDASGNAKVLLASTEDGPGLVFYVNGKVRAVLDVMPDGPRLVFYDEQKEVRAIMALVGDKLGFFLYDARGEVLWKAP